MARKNANTAKPKPKVRSRPSKPKKAKTGKRPMAAPEEEEAVVSRVRMIRHTGRGGRGR